MIKELVLDLKIGYYEFEKENPQKVKFSLEVDYMDNNIGLLIGAGSVGKKHAKTMSEIFDVLYVVDIDNNALDWCKENLKCSLKLFSNLEQAIYENNELQNTVCLIANWGIDHFDVLIKLIQKGLCCCGNSLVKLDEDYLIKFLMKNRLSFFKLFILLQSRISEKWQLLSSCKHVLPVCLWIGTTVF